MNKLIELLNEYEVIRIKEANNKKEVGNLDRYTPYRYTKQVIEGFSNTIISKSFGFIQRLVENDKIAYRRCLDLWYEIAVIDEEGEDIDVMRTFDSYEQLLMYLAIQDNPIEYLVSILK